MSQLDELRRIIVGDNSEELAALKNRVEDIDARTRDVAEVLVPAIHQGIRDGEGLVNALKHPVSESLKQAIRTEPLAYADILYPAIAPSIRLAISQAISSLLKTINQTIASATTVNGLRTRYESFRTGIPYAELALLQTLIYRVERVYLIDRDSGLLISECAASDDGALDSDAVSAMFSAIQSFVQDSFSGNEDDRLTDFKVGPHNIWIVHAPQAMLACVILGDAPEALKAQLYDCLDAIRTEYASQIANFQGDNSGFIGVEKHLQPLLQLRQKEGFESGLKLNAKVSPASKLLVLALIASAVYFIAHWIDRHSKLGTVRHYMAKTPGVVVTSAYWDDKRIVIEGLQDPDARPPYAVLRAHKINIEDLDLRTVPFRSLEAEMEIQRFAEELLPPSEVELIAGGRQVLLTGAAPIRWLLAHDSRLRQLSIDKRLDLSSLTASENSVHDYLEVALQSQPESLKQIIADSLLAKPWIKVSLTGLTHALATAQNKKNTGSDINSESADAAATE